MSTRISLLLLLLLHLPGSVLAESEFGTTGGVVTTIKPLHSLVAGVTGDITEPTLLVRGLASPHNFQLKPSQVKAIQNAKLVLYLGDDFETFMSSVLRTLPEDVRTSTAFSDAKLSLLPLREGGLWEEDAHDHDHAHGHFNLHVWLAPQNARRIVMWVTQELSSIDLENRSAYKANARRVIARIDALEKELENILAGVHDEPYIVFHDAYQYLEKAYGLNGIGSITPPSAETPPPSRIREMRAKLIATGAKCVFREPQYSNRLVQAVIEDTETSSGTLDPLGADIADGEDLYFDMMRTLANNLKQCLSS